MEGCFWEPSSGTALNSPLIESGLEIIQLGGAPPPLVRARRALSCARTRGRSRVYKYLQLSP